MFSYRHAFHAGNHADVLKHVVLVQLLDYLTRKDTPLWFVDTHAGAGRYRLDSAQALRRGEFRQGIGRLWPPPPEAGAPPPALQAYMAQVRRFNPEQRLVAYPGSPQIALQMLRPQDRLRLFELHPTEVGVLEQNLALHDRRVAVRRDDGFDAIRSVLPPPSRRALVLIDPSYEDKGDYQRVRRSVQEARRRFAQGVYLVWYPQVRHEESRRLAQNLRRIAGDNWLHASLSVSAPGPGGLGMHGSGVFVINQPWTLEEQLRAVMPWLVRVLGQDERAGFVLEASHS